ncbi:MAG: hypothetical protein JG776_1896 [Caloramator sp.]|uniref:XapX domain-containing protein n=1 Tax=Caloramator sp. TaxID=1871330 RepID=UPI001DE77436|nr:XapX domain-containing protein [Caloramator sp.]MBZ4664181.1 hypothetical protein [Caloramator sp.]
MMTILLATVAGMILGALFKKMNLPLPAPTTLPGVVGVLGVLLGSMIAKMF